MLVTPKHCLFLANFGFYHDHYPIKQQNKPKLPHISEHIPTLYSTKRRSKYTNEKLESLGMEYLPVGDEQQRETESKNAKNDDPRAANS